MKNLKQAILLLLTINCSLIAFHSSAQVLCIYCYDQNDSISHGVNNLIANGGFENSNCLPMDPNSSFCPNSQHHNCDIANWACTGGGIYTYAIITDSTFATIIEGTKAAYFGNQGTLICSPAFGDTSCLDNVGCTVFGIPSGYPVSRYQGYGDYSGVSLQQTVSGLTIGATYVLEFWAAGEEANFFVNGSIFAVDVGFGDTLLREFPTPRDSGIGRRYIVEFMATATSHTIKFTNYGHICINCTELILDDVRLYTLAELNNSVPRCLTTRIKEISGDASVTLFPNPATNEVTITNNNQEPSELELYDIASRKLMQESFIHSTSINIESLSRGLYLYQIKTKEGIVKNGKIVVNN